MKVKPVSRLKLLFILLPIMSVAFYALSAITGGNANEIFTPVEIVSTISDMEKPPEEGTPLDYSPEQNMRFANWIIYNSGYFKGESVGVCDADLGFTKYSQNVRNLRKVKDKTVFTETVSLSSLVKSAEQSYITDKDIALLRPAKVRGETVSWSDSIYPISTETFFAKYGAVPREITKYSVTEESIKTAEFAAFGNDEYVCRFELIPEIAGKYFKKEIRTRAGASQDAVIHSVTLTVTMDSKWIPKSLTCVDTYDVAIPVLGSMYCLSTMTEVFSDIGADKILDESEIFEPFLPADGDIGDTPVIPEEKSASTYLAEAFAPYLNGENLTVHAVLDVFGAKHDIKADIDISSMNIDALIDDALYIGYSDKTPYINAGGLKGYLPVDALKQLSDIDFGLDFSDFDFSKMLTDDIIGVLFGNSDLVKDGELVTINLKFKLSDLLKKDCSFVSIADKLDLDVDLIINDGEKISLNKIEATVKVDSVPIYVDIIPASGFEFPSHDGFINLENAVGFVKPIINTLNAPAYSLSLDIGIDSSVFSDKINAVVALNKDRTVSANISLAGLNIDVLFDGKTVYARSGNLGFTFELEDFDTLSEKLASVLELVKPLLPNLPSFDKDKLIEALVNIDLKKLLSHIEEFTASDDGKLRASINADGKNYGIDIAHDGTYLKSLSVDEMEFNGVKVKIDASLSILDESTEIKIPEIDYIDINDLADFAEPLITLAKAHSFGFDLTLFLNNSTARGRIDVVREDNGLSARFSLNIAGLNIFATIKDENIYIDCGAIKAVIDLNDKSELNRLLDKLTALGADIGSFGTIINMLAANMPSVDSLLNQALSSARMENGTLIIDLTFDDIGIKVSVSQTSNGLLTATVKTTVKGIDVSARLDITDTDVIKTIGIPDGTYVSANNLLQTVNAVMGTIDNTALTIGANVDINGFDATVTLKLNRDLSAIKATVFISEYDLTIDALYCGNAVYLSALGINIKVDSAGLGMLAKELTESGILPTDAESSVKSILSAIGALLDKDIDGAISALDTNAKILADKLITAFKSIKDGNLGDLIGLIPSDCHSVDLSEYISKLTEFTCTDTELRAAYDGAVIVLTRNGESLEALKISGGSYTVAIDSVIGIDTPHSFAVPTDCIELEELANYVPPIARLSEKRGFVLDFEAGITPQGSTVLTVTGQVSLFIKTDGLTLQLALRIPQSDKSAVDVVITYENGNYYIIYDGVRISASATDYDALVAILNPMLPAFTPRLIADIQKAVSEAMPNTDISSLLKMIKGASVSDGGSLKLDLNIMSVPIGIELSLKEKEFDGISLSAVLTDANIGTVSVKADLKLRKTYFAEETEKITIISENDVYTPASELIGYVDALINTFRQQAYRVTFDDIRVWYNDKTHKVTGYVEFLPTEGIPNLRLGFNVYETKADGVDADFANVSPIHTFDIMITDGDPLQEIYLTYNGVKFKLTIEEVLNLIGNIKDALNIKDGTLLDFVIPQNREKVSGEFLNDFAVSELTDMSEIINGLLDIVTQIYYEAQDFMNDPEYDYTSIADTANGILSNLTKLLGLKDVSTPTVGDIISLINNLPKVSLSSSTTTDGSSSLMTVYVNGTGFTLTRANGDNPRLLDWGMSNLAVPSLNTVTSFHLTLECPSPNEITIDRPIYHDYNYATSGGGVYKKQELIDNICNGKIDGVALPYYKYNYIDYYETFTDEDIIAGHRYNKSGIFNVTYTQNNNGSYIKVRTGDNSFDYINKKPTFGDTFTTKVNNETYVTVYRGNEPTELNADNAEYWTKSYFESKKYLVTTNHGASTTDFDSYYNEWFVFNYGMSYDKYYNAYLKGNCLNDLSDMSNLTTALLNTANLKDFHISGAIGINIIGAIKTNVPLDLRVKLIPVTENGVEIHKPLVIVSVSTKKAVLGALGASATQIYYWDGYMYFIKLDADNKWHYVKMPIEQLANDMSDANKMMDYVFFALPLANWIQNMINIDTNSSLGKFEDFFTDYYFTGGKHYINIDLGKLANNSSLSAAEVIIGTGVKNVGEYASGIFGENETVFGNNNRTFITNLRFNTTMVGVVEMKLNVSLGIGEKVTSFMVPTKVNDSSVAYTEYAIHTADENDYTDIYGLLNYLNSSGFNYSDTI